MSTVKVEVTADDIAKGKPCEPCMCPVALAVERVLTDDAASLFLITDRYLEWAGQPSWLPGPIELPAPAQVFITLFDDGTEVGPFGFEIELPDELLAVSP